MAWFYLAAIAVMLGSTWFVVTAATADLAHRRRQGARVDHWVREREEAVAVLVAPQLAQAQIESSAVIIGEVVE